MTPTNKPSQGTPTLRDRFAKAFHDNGLCEFDYGTWQQLKESGRECECYEMADMAVKVAAQQPTASEPPAREEKLLQEMGGLREAAEWMKAQSQRTDIGPSRREAFELSWRKLEAALNE